MDKSAVAPRGIRHTRLEGALIGAPAAAQKTRKTVGKRANWLF